MTSKETCCTPATRGLPLLTALPDVHPVGVARGNKRVHFDVEDELHGGRLARHFEFEAMK